jgi:hypothetical protein
MEPDQSLGSHRPSVLAHVDVTGSDAERELVVVWPERAAAEEASVKEEMASDEVAASETPGGAGVVSSPVDEPAAKEDVEGAGAATTGLGEEEVPAEAVAADDPDGQAEETMGVGLVGLVLLSVLTAWLFSLTLRVRTTEPKVKERQFVCSLTAPVLPRSTVRKPVSVLGRCPHA